jgi:hypothetical protein
MPSLLGVEVAMGLTPPLAEMSGVKEAPRAPSPQNYLCGVAGGACIVGGKGATAAAVARPPPNARFDVVGLVNQCGCGRDRARAREGHQTRG